MTSHESASARPLTAAEIDAVRTDFPYLKRPARNGEPLAYLDWAATSQKPADVIEREASFYRMTNGAAGRSTYQIADEATRVWEDAREAVAGFVGARGSQLVFTKNATEAINLVALAVGRERYGKTEAVFMRFNAAFHQREFFGSAHHAAPVDKDLPVARHRSQAAFEKGHFVLGNIEQDG